MKKTKDTNNVSVLKGFSLPLSPNGDMSLVSSPPWYFGGELMEVVYRTDSEKLASFVPSPFKLIPGRPFMSIAIVDMISLNNTKEAFTNPERTQYKECLIKIYCLINNQPVWYVPTSWVTTDFSLMRGFLMGFGKKLGIIATTKLHELNPALGNKRAGSKLKGICEAFNGIHIQLELSLTKQVDKLEFTGMDMCVCRHFPDVENPKQPLVHDVSKLSVSDYKRGDIWLALGDVKITNNPNEPISALQPKEIITARTYREGFTLEGVKSIFRY